jgi:N-acetylglucosamine-6-phosphate deacetylase
MASLIVDGHHLPPEVVQTFVRAKSADRCLLVSDITGLGGMPPGRYESTGLASVEVLEDGRLVVAGQRQYLAGAALPLSAGVVNVMSFAQVDLATAIRMAADHPARLMGLNVGQLQVGATADLIQFQLEDHPSRRFQLLATLKAGALVHGSIT